MTWLLLALAALVLAALWVRVLASITIFEHERALKFVRGRLVDLVGPGLYWYSRRTTTFRRVDIRPTTIAVSGQEVLSADGLALKLSVVATYRVTDPKLAILGIDDYSTAVHTQLQMAIRGLVSTQPAEDLMAKRADLSSHLLAAASPSLTQIGLELQSAALRDLTLPGELKKIFSQVVRARQEGLAALEKARGETAALRGLANAANMVQQNPLLLQLRLVQVLEQQSGHTVVLGAPPGLIPIASRQSASPPGPSPDQPGL